MMPTRIEKDFLGTVEMPDDRCWGIHTERAVRNFPISARLVNPELIRAMAMVKKACCLANEKTGFLEERKALAIKAACDKIIV